MRLCLCMSPVSLVFHTIVTIRLNSKMYSEQIHLLYNIRYPCFSSWASRHSFSFQATQHKQIITPRFLLAHSPLLSCFETLSQTGFTPFIESVGSPLHEGPPNSLSVWKWMHLMFNWSVANAKLCPLYKDCYSGL